MNPANAKELAAFLSNETTLVVCPCLRILYEQHRSTSDAPAIIKQP